MKGISALTPSVLRMLRGGNDIGLLSMRMWFAEIRELGTNARLVGTYAVPELGVRCQCQDNVYDIVPQRASVKAPAIEGGRGADHIRQHRRTEARDQLAGMIAGLGR